MKKALATALILVLAVASSASAAYRWRSTSHAMPGTLQQEIFEQFAETIKTLSKGELIIEPFAAGVLFPVFDTLDNVQNGMIEMAMIYGAYYPGKDPMFLLTTRPGCPISTYAEGAYLDEKLEPLRVKLWKKFGIQYLGHIQESPIKEQFMSTLPMNSIDDLKGKKIRTSGFGARFYDALGATSVSLSPTEIYTALQTKNIDALEWTFWEENMRLNFHEVVTYVLDPAPHQGITENYPLLVNQEKWDALPQDLKDIVLVARDQARYRASMLLVEEIKARELWKKMPNMTLVKWTPEEEKKALAIGQSLVKEECEKLGEDGKQYLEIYSSVLWELGYTEDAKNLGYVEK
jgi:TRAP-type mannitol/chloroaromatic compound transport system substrate-binding protein